MGSSNQQFLAIILLASAIFTISKAQFENFHNPSPETGTGTVEENASGYCEDGDVCERSTSGPGCQTVSQKVLSVIKAANEHTEILFAQENTKKGYDTACKSGSCILIELDGVKVPSCKFSQTKKIKKTRCEDGKVCVAECYSIDDYIEKSKLVDLSKIAKKTYETDEGKKTLDGFCKYGDCRLIETKGLTIPVCKSSRTTQGAITLIVVLTLFSIILPSLSVGFGGDNTDSGIEMQKSLGKGLKKHSSGADRDHVLSDPESKESSGSGVVSIVA